VHPCPVSEEGDEKLLIKSGRPGEGRGKTEATQHQKKYNCSQQVGRAGLAVDIPLPATVIPIASATPRLSVG